MKIAICDDCREDILSIKNFLGGHDIKLYSDADSLLGDMEDYHMRYDLYLLDIYLKGAINGIELAKKLRFLDEEAVICFVSTSDDFYREAYDLYALQYLIKPVTREDIKKLVDKVAGNLIRNKEQSICIKRQGEICTIPYGKVLYVSSRGHILSVYCKDGTMEEFKGKLSDLELQGRGDTFCRCHQSFLVNLYQVDRMSGNELYVSDYRIPISRRYYAEVKKHYQKILFEGVE